MIRQVRNDLIKLSSRSTISSKSEVKVNKLILVTSNSLSYNSKLLFILNMK